MAASSSTLGTALLLAAWSSNSEIELAVEGSEDHGRSRTSQL